MSDKKRAQIIREFAEVLNRHSLDNALNTPDFILAEMLMEFLDAINIAQDRAKDWRKFD